MFFLRALLGAATFAVVASQPTIGTDLCSCSPSRYVFSFNFSGSCNSSTVVTGQQGVNEAACKGGNTTAPAVLLSSVLVTDLDANLDSRVSVQAANLTSSDTINYNAFNAYTNVSAIQPSAIPRGIGVIMTAVTADGETVQMSIAIIFTEECDTFPILSAGDSIGWLVISNVTAPPVEFCPSAAGAPTIAVTSTPTMAAPATALTSSPMISPNVTIAPQVQPSSAPVALPVTGQDVCACQPQNFTIVLDLQGRCDINDFEGSPGIEETVCAILDEKNLPTSGRAPVSIMTVRISEFGQSLKDIIAQKSFEGNFTTGKTFEYQGFLANETVVPSLLLVELLGVDSNGETLDNSWVIGFTNDCDTFPVIVPGQQLGWAIVESVQPPPSSICPAVALPTPTLAPAGTAPALSDTPSDSPSDTPSDSSASDTPSDSPSDFPSDFPTSDPILLSDVPSDSPSGMPSVAGVTGAPVTVETPTSSPIAPTPMPAVPPVNSTPNPTSTPKPPVSSTPNPTRKPFEPTTPNPTMPPVDATTPTVPTPVAVPTRVTTAKPVEMPPVAPPVVFDEDCEEYDYYSDDHNTLEKGKGKGKKDSSMKSNDDDYAYDDEKSGTKSGKGKKSKNGTKKKCKKSDATKDDKHKIKKTKSEDMKKAKAGSTISGNEDTTVNAYEKKQPKDEYEQTEDSKEKSNKDETGEKLSKDELQGNDDDYNEVDGMSSTKEKSSAKDYGKMDKSKLDKKKKKDKKSKSYDERTPEQDVKKSPKYDEARGKKSKDKYEKESKSIKEDHKESHYKEPKSSSSSTASQMGYGPLRYNRL